MENKSQEKSKIKILHKPAKGRMGALLVTFAWIAVWNIIYQAVHGLWAESSIQIVNWAFFATVTLFFMQEELTYKQRFWHTLIGGAVGLLFAAFIGIVCTVMMQNGISYLTSVAVPLIISIAMLILLNPYLPAVFNNVGFIYLIIAFVEAEKVVEMLPSYLISLLLGSLILNLGCTFLLNAYTKAMTKKAMAAAAEKEAATK